MQQVLLRVLGPAQPDQAAGDPAVHVAAQLAIAKPHRRREREFLGPQALAPLPAQVEDWRERPRQLGRGGVKPVRGRPFDRAHQDRVLRVEPRHRRLAAFRRHPDDPCCRGLKLCGPPVGIQRFGRQVRAVGVMLEHPDGRGVPHAGGLGGRGQLRRVGAQQVVEGVAARHALGHQMRGGEFPQQGPGPLKRCRRKARRGRDGDIRTAMQAQQPEKPCRVGAEGAIRPGEDGDDVGVKPFGELRRDRLEREVRVQGRLRGDHRQGQRQPGAAVDDLVRRPRIGAHPRRPQAQFEQAPRLHAGHRVEHDGPRASLGDEPGQPVAAGDYHRAAGGAGQQRPDLVGVARVVQQHQHSPVRHQAAVHADLRLHPGRNALRRRAKRVEETADRLGHRRRGA